MMQKLKKIALLNMLMLLSYSNFAQIKFEKVYGSTGYDYGYSVTQMYDTGYAVVGTTTSFGSGSTDMYLLKTNSLGVAVGQKTFGGINIDQAYSVKSTNDSGLVIAGYTNSYGFGGYDMYVIKTDKNCDTLWTKTYGGTNWDFAYSIEQTSDNGYIIAGGTYSSGNGSEDMYLVKTNAAGDTLWTKTYGGTNDDEAKSVKQTSDGGYILTGFSKSFGDINGDIFTVKTNNLGDTLWTYKYRGTLDDLSYDVLEDNTGAGYIIAGETKSVAMGFQGLVIRLNLSGALISTAPYGASANDGINAITQTADGRFATMGYTYSFGAGASDFAFYIENPIGTYVGSVTYGGAKIDKGYCIKNTFDGGFIICGTTLSFSTFDRIYLIKTDSLGASSGSVISVATNINNSNFTSTSDEFLVYPNPATNTFYVQPSARLSSPFSVAIYDVVGKLVYAKDYTAHSNAEPILFDAELFEAGLYFITITGDNYLANQKLLIQK